ncbi:competence type IV pilus minor pilin ComGD [Enterococcus avium]|uniref:competence type IV pilus minor pilin ComGD n=1 Tax=Enterococcus TaxID=1350 RepID=UPI0008A576DF|nr:MULTISPECIES: competence type IV pilus minor pilin ComGD [Enterococcus]MDT2382417.1 competence type IV pilus minor pilin ComGD [Enterococcus avium]OFN63183.1 N-terminal cleavage protein [Enterococcus sp. HMSC064A12]
MYKRNKFSGFTLIETLIVLALVCAFVLLPTIAIKSWQHQLEKNFFYYQFEKSTLHLQQVAIADHQRTRISLNSSSQLIDFYTNHTELSWRILPVPKSIKLGSRYSIYFKAGSGNVSTDQPGNGNIPKVVFTDEGKVITYQFQMESGNLLTYQRFKSYLPQIYHNLQIINQFPHHIRRFFFFFFQYVTVHI